jgi:hypothetical protein
MTLALLDPTVLVTLAVDDPKAFMSSVAAAA